MTAASLPDRRHSVARAGRLLPWLLMAVCVALGAQAPNAQAPALEVAVLRADESIAFERIRDNERVSDFSAVQGAVAAATPPGQQLWLRLRGVLPSAADDEAGPWMLVFERLPIERVQFHLPQADGRGWERHDDQFLHPSSSAPAGVFAASLDRLRPGPFEAYIAVRSRAQASLLPRLESMGRLHAADTRHAALSATAHALVLASVVVGLALFGALRQAWYASFALFAGLVLLSLLAMSGALYDVAAGRAVFGWLGLTGACALALPAAAAAIDFDRRWLPLPAGAVWQRLPLALAGLLVIAAVLVAIRVLPTIAAQRVSGLLLLVAALWLIAAAAMRVRQGERLAGLMLVPWLLFAIAVACRGLLHLQWIAPGLWTMAGMALLAAVALLALSTLLIARVAEFRVQRDIVQQLHVQSDADLQLEQRRRQFGEALQEALRNAVAPGDLEWRAFKQLLQTVGSLLPHRAIALSASGYRGFDFLLTEPMNAKPHYCNLLAARAATLKGICRSRSPVQLKLELDVASPTRAGETSQFAIIPLQIARPGWGALLVERDGDAVFEPRELALAAEFVALTLAAAEDGALKAELRRTADVDPLTGVLNRRAGDERIEQAFRRSIAERSPLALMLVDIDHFKLVNDRHGHATGDECLRALAAAIRPHLAADDVLLRYGGEEFMVVLPGRGIEQAREIAERIRAQAAMLRVEADGALVKLTVSIGVGVRAPNDERTQPLVQRVDRAMYTAKRAGRNQVQIASVHGGEGEPSAYPPVY